MIVQPTVSIRSDTCILLKMTITVSENIYKECSPRNTQTELVGMHNYNNTQLNMYNKYIQLVLKLKL